MTWESGAVDMRDEGEAFAAFASLRASGIDVATLMALVRWHERGGVDAPSGVRVLGEPELIERVA